MSHANQLNFPVADRSQQPVNSVAFYDPNKFNSSNATAIPTYDPGLSYNAHRETALPNATGSSWQPQINPDNQWNFNINNGQSWSAPGNAGHPLDSTEYYDYEQQMHYQQGQLTDRGSQWVQDLPSQQLGAESQWAHNQQGQLEGANFQFASDPPVQVEGASTQWVHDQQYPVDDSNTHWSPDESSVKSYDGSGYFPQNVLYPNTGAHFDQPLGMQAVGSEQPGFEGYNSFLVGNYPNQYGQPADDVYPAVNGNDLPKVNSFKGSLNEPSPFDDIVSDAGIPSEPAEPLGASHTHSRNSSYGGVNFLIGGSGNTSECPSNADSPRSFVRDKTCHKASSVTEVESVEGGHAITEAFDEIALGQPHESAENMAPSDNADSLSTPPKMLPLHSTMAGTPTGNQFRIRKPVNASNIGHFTSIPNELALDTSSGPLSNSNIGNVIGDYGQSRAVEVKDPVIGPSVLQSSSDHGVTGGSSSAGIDHMMNIYASPIMPHRDSSFTPVGSGLFHSASQHQKSSPHSVSAVERESSASESSHLDTEEIENDALLDNRLGSAAQGGFLDRDYPVVHNSPQRQSADMTGSRMHFGTHKSRREATLSPATTLWENPEPVGVRLVPALAAGGVEVKQHHEKSLVADFLQNTGTGPSRLQGNMLPLEPSVPVDSRVSATTSKDQLFPQTPERQLPTLSVPSASHQVLNADVLSFKSGLTDNVTAKDIPSYASPLQQSFSPTSEKHEFVDFLPAGSKQLADSGMIQDAHLSSFVQPSQPSVEKLQLVSDQSSYEGAQVSQVNNMSFNSGPMKSASVGGQVESQVSSAAVMHSSAMHLGSKLVSKVESNGQVLVKEGERDSARAGYGDKDADQLNMRSNKESYSQFAGEIQGSSIRDDRRSELGVAERDPSHERRSDIMQSDQLRSEGHFSRTEDRVRERGTVDIPVELKRDRPLSRQDDDDYRRRGTRSDIEDYDRHRPRPDSRRGYSDQRQERPLSRNDYDDRSGKTNSRYDYDKYDRQNDRPSSRQGRDDPRYGRPQSVQSMDEYDRPRSRQDDFSRSGSRREYDDRYYERPRSRLDDSYRSGSKKDYDDRSYDGSRSRVDDPYRGGPRREYEDQSLERPRSRQGFRDEHSGSRSGRPTGDPYLKPQGPLPDNRYRPRSRQDYPDEYDSDRRRYDDRRLERPSSRRDMPDDPHNRSYSSSSSASLSQRRPGEDPRRPHSRQDERLSNNGDSSSSRQQRTDHDRYGSERDRSRPEYGGHRSGYGYYDPYGYGYGDTQYQNYYQGYPRDPRDYYYYPESMDPRYLEQLNDYYKGYYQELSGSYQPQVYDPRYDDGRQNSGVFEHGSRHSSVRASVEDLSAADHFARLSEHGSRPGSVMSGLAPSVVSISQKQSYADYEAELSYPHSRQVEEPVLPQRLTPHKFIIPHMRVSFGSAGRLIRILPNSPADGQPALLEIIDFTGVLANSYEAQTLKQFPGPLVRVETHKNDVLHYCQNMTSLCRSSPSFVDRESAELLWRFLELLIKQNGTLIGTDIADLLLDGHEPPSRSFSRVPDSHIAAVKSDRQLAEASRDSTTPDRSLVGQEISADNSVVELTDRFRHLLLHGRKKDALEWAVKQNLWGHALFLASKMDAKTHASILTRFANISMKVNDPLQTLYQIMSGRQPAASTLAADEKWGDWRPHLSIILSNATQRPELDRKSIITLGDTLASRGLVYSSHFCYLVVSMMMSRDDNNVNGLFGPHSSKSSKLVLIGASHSIPFEEFANNIAAVQCTEVYEYSMSLGNPQFFLPSFQLFRFMYLVRLVDYGLFEEALRYAEFLARIISLNPHMFPPSMARSLYHLADKLRYCEPQRAVSEESGNPEWMQHLAAVTQAMEDGRIVYQQQQPFTAVVQSMQPHVSGAGTPHGARSTHGGSECGDTTNSVNLMSGFQHNNTSWNQSYVETPAAAVDGTAYESSPAGHASQPIISNEFQIQPPVHSYMSGIVDPMHIGTNLNNEQHASALNPVATSAVETDVYHGYNDGQHAVVQPGYNQGFAPSNMPPEQNSEPQVSLDQQPSWNQYQPVLHPVPELTSTNFTSNSQEFAPLSFTASAIGTQETTSLGYTGFVPNDVTSNFQSNSSSLPPMMHSTRQRTTSSSSSNHSHNGPGSRRNSLVPSTRDGPGTPVTNQASNESIPSGSLPSSSSSSLHVSTSSLSSVPSNSMVTGEVFRFGVPPPPSTAYTFEGANAPLGVNNMEQKKRTYWPGQELDDELDKGNKPSKSSGEITKAKDSNGWLSRFFPGRKNRPKEMILPDDKNPSIIWDPKLNRYINKDDEGKDSADGAEKRELPPPTDSEVQQKQIPSALPASVSGPNVPRMTYNRPKVRGARGQYVDVLGGTTKPATAPNSLFSVLPKSASMPASIFVPNAMAANQQESESVEDNQEPQMNLGSQPGQNLSSDPAAASALYTASYPKSQSMQSQPPAMPTVNEQVPQIPMMPSQPLMFNPAQVNLVGPQSHTAAAPGTGLHYGQRRQYPQK